MIEVQDSHISSKRCRESTCRKGDLVSVVNLLDYLTLFMPFASEIRNKTCEEGVIHDKKRAIIANAQREVMRPRGMNTLRLLLAAQKHDCSEVEALIEVGVNVNLTDDEYGQTPLHSVAHKGCLKCTQLLLRRNADINKRTRGGASSDGTFSVCV